MRTDSRLRSRSHGNAWKLEVPKQFILLWLTNLKVPENGNTGINRYVSIVRSSINILDGMYSTDQCSGVWIIRFFQKRFLGNNASVVHNVLDLPQAIRTANILYWNRAGLWFCYNQRAALLLSFPPGAMEHLSAGSGIFPTLSTNTISYSAREGGVLSWQQRGRRRGILSLHKPGYHPACIRCKIESEIRKIYFLVSKSLPL